MSRELIKTRRYKVGYEILYERISGDEAGGGAPFIIRSAHTIPEGHYIGDPRMAHNLIVQRGIKPEPRTPSCPSANGGRGRTCSIGFCEREQKWYGWSHRAIFGFGIGDIVKDGDCTASSGWLDEYLLEHPDADLSLPVGFEAETLEDAKRMAVAFAESVG